MSESFITKKRALTLNGAGASRYSPILAPEAGGWPVEILIPLGDDEIILSVNVKSSSGSIPASFSQYGRELIVSLNFDATSVWTGALAVENTLVVASGYSTRSWRFWAQEPPDVGAIYANNIPLPDADGPTFFAGNDNPANESSDDLSIALAILPTIAGEHLYLGEFDGNRYANTRQPYGGAVTCEILLNGSPFIPESPIQDIHNLYLFGPSKATKVLTARLRCEAGSASYVDVIGSFDVALLVC